MFGLAIVRWRMATKRRTAQARRPCRSSVVAPTLVFIVLNVVSSVLSLAPEWIEERGTKRKEEQRGKRKKEERRKEEERRGHLSGKKEK